MTGNLAHCSKCGGTMNIKTIGTMEDKIYHCPFCGNILDIQDSFRKTEIEESESHSGNSSTKTKRTVIKERFDGPLTDNSGFQSMFDNPDFVQSNSTTINLDGDTNFDSIREALKKQNCSDDMIEDLLGKLNMQSGDFSASESNYNTTIIDEESTTSFHMTGTQDYSQIPKERLLKDLKDMNPNMSSSELLRLAEQLQRNSRSNVGSHAAKKIGNDLLGVAIIGIIIIVIVLFIVL